MTALAARLIVVLLGCLFACHAWARVGADLPWTTYEAESMRTNGVVLGPKYEPNSVETEASGQECVRLVASGDYVEFTARVSANALVVRYSLPDSEGGGGVNSSLDLMIDGKVAKRIPLTSRYAHLYGTYPFSNDPKMGKPRNFFDEARVSGLTIEKGSTVRLQRPDADTAYCIVDLVDLEQVGPPLREPAGAINVLIFGADPQGASDSTDAMKRCIAEAQKRRHTVWLPPGNYKITGELVVPSSVTIQGAGMWHTNLIGDDSLYGQAAHRVRLKLTGSQIHLADFSIIGRLNYRNDDEPNDGIVGAGCADSSISRIWIEHTKVGIWIYNGVNLRVEGCRIRDTIADGINLCVGTSGTIAQNCSTRGTGDDCFAVWPAASDQGFETVGPKPGNNIFRNCTGQLTFLANGGAIYGGESNRLEDCLFTDIGTGCGILISTTFPTSDEARKVDNNFSGHTIVRNCELLRCGGYDHSWAWRGSIQICMDRRSISGLTLSDVTVRDSISSGVTLVAPGSARGVGNLSDAVFQRVHVENAGIGSSPHHDLWVLPGVRGSLTLIGSSIDDIKNDSEQFILKR